MSRFMAQKLAALKPYTPGEQPQGMDKLIKINTNESPYPPSPMVINAITAAAVEKLRLYNDTECTALLDALARTYNVKRTQVIASNGSDEILAFAFNAFCQNGAAFPDITYGFYPVFAQLFGVNYNEIPLTDSFEICLDDYKNEAGTVFVANPNAPTGICLPLCEIENLLNQNKDRLVVVDEAYVDFGGESAVTLLPKYDNLLVVGTFSKSRSLAGARLGFAMGSEALIADLNKVKFSFNPYNVNALTQLAGTAALKDVEYFDKCRFEIIETREFTKQSLETLGFTVLPSKANFIFAKPPKGYSGDEYFADLRKNGILVRHFSIDRIKEYNRVTIGTKAQMQTLINVTKALLKEKKL